MFYQQHHASTTGNIPTHKQQPHEGWGRHAAQVYGVGGAGMVPPSPGYGGYPQQQPQLPHHMHHAHQAQHHQQQPSFSHSAHNLHQSPALQHAYANGQQTHQASPPAGMQRIGGDSESQWWQQQMVKLKTARSYSNPHHRARAKAQAGRMTTNKSVLSITDPNRPPSTKPLNGFHRRDGSASDDRDDESDLLSSSYNGGGGGYSPVPSRLGTVTDATTFEPWNGLDLGGMHLKVLSNTVFAYAHVTELYINHNALTSLPASISHLKKLTTLDATGNQLTSIPPELGMLVHLKDLILFDNQINDLPYELGTLHQLDCLGIAGNPIPESFRLILEKDGTSALIAYLRDSCPVALPPPDRPWVSVEAETSSSEAPETFTLMTYNILNERYAPIQSYGYTPAWALAWEYRKDLLLQEVIGFGADIICLQEVDEAQFNDFFLANLSEQGYEGAHFPKTRARTMASDEKKAVDGGATFWKSSKLNLVEKKVIEFNQVALQRPDMRKSDDMFNRIMSKDHVAVVCLFETKETGNRLVVSNAHLEWSPAYCDVKLVQAAMLVEEAEKIANMFAKYPPMLLPDGSLGPTYSNGQKIPLILAGDYNSVPETAVYTMLSKGEIEKDHADFMGHSYGNYTTDGIHHNLNLKSAYSSLGELSMTNFTSLYVGAIDYIWYSASSLSVTNLLGEVDAEYLSRSVGFPNPHFPSDHIPIIAELKFKPQQAASTARQVTHS